MPNKTFTFSQQNYAQFIIFIIFMLNVFVFCYYHVFKRMKKKLAS